MSHVIRICRVCTQRFVGGRSSVTCSRECDERVPRPTTSVGNSAPVATVTHAERVSSRERAVSLSQLREALRASVRRQIEEGRRRAAS